MASRRNSPSPQPSPSAPKGKVWVTSIIACTIALGGMYLLRQLRGTAEVKSDDQPKDQPVLKAMQSGLQQTFQGTPGTTTSVADLIARMNDESLDLISRRDAARTLAGLDDPAALAALKAMLVNASTSLKTAIAEGLSGNHAPAALQLLLSLLHDADEAVSSAAIQSLAQLNPEGIADFLSNVLFDSNAPAADRAEAAAALGESSQPGAYDALIRAITTIKDDSVVQYALAGLGKRPLTETNEFLSAYLAATTTPTADKVAALEALANSPNQTGAFLLKYATDADPAIREAAVWAIAASGNPGDVAGQLSALLQNETNEQVRASLYQAISQQPGFDAAPILPMVAKETDAATRLAGLGLLAAASRAEPSSNIATYFDQNAVAELAQVALQSNDSSNRLLAVIDLRRARTPGSNEALQEIASQSTDPKVVEAAQAALRTARVPATAGK